MAQVRLLTVGIALAILTVLASPAGAQYVGGAAPTVGSDYVGDPAPRSTAPAATATGAVQGASGGLALTGVDVAQLITLAGGFVVVGLVLTRSAGRKPATA